MNNRWRKILSNFEIEGTPIEISRLGKGLINDTYKLRIVEPDLPDYVVQRINSDVFKDVDKMQRNIDRVTAHIREKMFERGVPGGPDRLLTFVRSRTGKSYYEADGEFWRVSKYIDRSKSIDACSHRHNQHALKRKIRADISLFLRKSPPYHIDTDQS